MFDIHARRDNGLPCREVHMLANAKNEIGKKKPRKMIHVVFMDDLLM